jgi:transcriptional regulator with XRE-family HTH domain
VGDTVGVWNTAISAIEIGRNSVPPERYKDFADVLGIPRKEWARFILEQTDPWLYALLFDDEKKVSHRIKTIPERVGDTRRTKE